jgi:FixJ family two-component response regulator
VFRWSQVGNNLMPQPRKSSRKVSSTKARSPANKRSRALKSLKKSPLPPCVHLVTDPLVDHQDFLEALANWPCRLVQHATPEEAIAKLPATGVDCVVIYESGGSARRKPMLFETLIYRRGCPPIIFVAKSISWQWAVDVMGRGALNVLATPLDPTALLESLERACTIGKTRTAQMLLLADLDRRRSTLTPRQAEVLDRLMSGTFSTRELGEVEQRTERTIENHRNKIMKKLGFSKIVQVVAFEYERMELERLLDAPASFQR